MVILLILYPTRIPCFILESTFKYLLHTTRHSILTSSSGFRIRTYSLFLRVEIRGYRVRPTMKMLGTLIVDDKRMMKCGSTRKVLDNLDIRKMYVRDR